MEIGTRVFWSLRQVVLALTASALACGAVDWSPRATAQQDDRSPRQSAEELGDEPDSAEQTPGERRNRRRGRARRGGWFFGPPSWTFTNGPDVRKAFRDVVSEATKSMVCVHCDGKHTILGCVVANDGWVLTKASVLSGELTVHNADNDEFPAELVASDNQYDLALLKAEGSEGIPSVELADVEMPQVGSWLATVGKTSTPVAIGVMSVPPREIQHQPGVLGVQLEDPESEEGRDRPIVGQVFPDSAAEEAGIQVNDLIIRVGEQQVDTREELVNSIRSHNPNDQVRIVVQRDGEELEFTARLGSNLPRDMEMRDRDSMQNMMGGDLSDRRFGFPMAFQHDTVLRPMDCGGPIVNLDGKVVGFNVARSGRTESYAVDVATVRRLVESWMNQGETEMVKTRIDAAKEDAVVDAPPVDDDGNTAPAE